MKQYRAALWQFLKFGLVGISNTLIALAVYYVWLYFAHDYMQANFISWLVSVFNAFYWNNRYVFQNTQKWHIALLRTYLSYGLSLVVSLVLLYIQIEWMEISDKVAPILVLLVTIPMNFILNKYWTFR